MKASPAMQQFVSELAEHYGVDLAQVGAYLRLDQPGYDSLVVDHIGASQIAVACTYEECGQWQIDREVVFFTGYTPWVPMEITQSATGWTAFAKLDANDTRIVRINHCGQEKLAEFTERWAHQLRRQNWLAQGTPYQPWMPPTREEIR